MTPSPNGLWHAPNDPAGHHLFALVDHAGCDSLMPRLSHSRSLQWINLFEGSTEAGAIQVAPILVDLGGIATPSATAQRFLSGLSSVCQTSNALLVMRSTWSLPTLATALRARLDALLPDDLPVLLRYFDTRVHAALLSVLREDQCAEFYCPASHWWWFDRAGRWCDLASQECETDTLQSPMTLDAKQQTQLIAASEADAVAHEVRLAAPDLCKGWSRAQLHEHVAHCLPAAQGHNIGGLSMQTLFCIVALELGVGFDEQPEWSAAFKAASTQGRDFAWVVHQVEKEENPT